MSYIYVGISTVGVPFNLGMFLPRMFREPLTTPPTLAPGLTTSLSPKIYSE